MALPSPPSSISLSQVNIELGNPGTTEISMNDAAVRSLFAVPTGEISMSDGFGKSAGISGITVTMPHPQPLPPSPGLQYNAGPIPGSTNAPPPPQPIAVGSSCSPNPLARQFVFTPFGYPGLPGPSRVATREKDVTVSYSGGPAGPGTHSNTLALSWSISTDCPVYSPTAGVFPSLPGEPAAIPVRVVSTSAPKIVVDVGLCRPTSGGSNTSGSNEPFPGQPALSPPNISGPNNIHTRYIVTGTAPAPDGGASGSTSWGVVCLPMDTEVTMEDGSAKPMKDVKVGDKVKTFDTDTGQISSNEVTHLLKRHVASELIHIKLENDIEFRATPEHECWIRREDEGMWIMAELIEEGDSMLTEGIEYQKVIKVEKVEYEEGIEVGNISVADAHVYFANKVLLHNFTGL